MMKLRTVVATALALASFVPPAAAGNDSPQTAVDPVGDGVGGGDIVALRVAQDGGPIELRVRTREGNNIRTGPAWQPGSRSQLVLNMNNGSDGRPQWAVIITPSPSGARARVVWVGPAPDPTPPCVGLSQPSPAFIQVRVRQVCLGLPGAFRAFARYRYDRGGNGTVDSSDRAPDFGYTPTINILN